MTHCLALEAYGAAQHRAAHLALARSDATERRAWQQPCRCTTALRDHRPETLACSKQRRPHALRRDLHYAAERLLQPRVRVARRNLDPVIGGSRRSAAREQVRQNFLGLESLIRWGDLLDEFA